MKLLQSSFHPGDVNLQHHKLTDEDPSEWFFFLAHHGRT